MEEQKEDSFIVSSDEGWQRYKRRKRIIRIVIASIAVFLVLLTVFILVCVPLLRYYAAMRLFDEGRYEEAIYAFDALNGYRDSRMRISECYIRIYGMDLYKKSLRVQPGNIMTLGTYEQDNDLSNGPEPIEWVVLTKYETMALLVSKYALDCRPYHPEDTDVTWETSDIRAWLNDTFLDSAFTRLEQRSIVSATIHPDQDSIGREGQERKTTDKVFLLSISEAYWYFGDPNSVETEKQRICVPTAYALSKGCMTDEYGSCWWWLRSSGLLSNYAARVNMEGGIYSYGYSVFNDMGTVRPAIWIDIGAVQNGN